VFGVVMGGLAAGLLVLPAPAQPSSEVVRIGLVKTLFRGTPDSIMQLVMSPFKALLEAQTGVTGQIVSAADSNELAKKLDGDQVQLGVFHGYEYAWAKEKYPALKPLAVAVNRHPELRACLVVRSDSKAANYADLEGKVMALPCVTREHCRLFFERKCVKPGVAARKFYRELSDPADAEEALDDVFEKRASAAVVDAVSLEEYRSERSARGKQLKVLDDSGSMPCAVVVYKSGRFNEELVGSFRTALLSARENKSGKKMLEMIRITGFAKVPEGYDKQLSDTVKNYPPPVAK